MHLIEKTDFEKYSRPQTGELIKLILKDIPVRDLVRRVDSEPMLWKENTWRQNYVEQGERPISPQQDTEALMFRWAPENTIGAVRDSLEVVEHPNYHNVVEIQPILNLVLAAVGATECGRVFIAKLKPGGFVVPHRDYGMYADHFERFHLVLTSEVGNEFFVEDHNHMRQSKHMKPGELYWFNHKDVHWAFNDSETPRMHLIIDAVAPDFRRERVSIQP